MIKADLSLPKWARVLIPSVLILIWLILGSVGGPYFGKIGEVASNDQSTFLPESAESTKANAELKKFQDDSAVPAIIVFTDNDNKLSPENLKSIKESSAKLSQLDGVSEDMSPPIPSDDGKAALMLVNIDSNVDFEEVVPEIRSAIKDSGMDIDYKVTGPVGFLSDLSSAFAGIDGLLLGVALTVVFIILLIVYRSPILPILVLLNSIFALSAAILLVYYLAKADIVTINGQVQGILFILVIGAATDYALLFVARFREELSRHKQAYQAIVASWRRSFEPILAAGGTVTAGLLCLLLSDLSSNKALGPVGAIGIALAIISALTLLPSLLLVFGRKVFWPRIPEYQKLKTEKDKKGLWNNIAGFVERRARKVWLVTACALVIASFGLLGLRADGVSQSDLILGTSEARDGQSLLDQHFPGGSGDPTQIIAKQDKSQLVMEELNKDEGIAFATLRSDGPAGPSSFGDSKPKVVDGNVLIEATLKNNSDSSEAKDTIQRIRSSVHAIDSSALVGGSTAVQLDTQESAKHDRKVVIPAVLAVITIILMLLLRSILAPILLLLTTVLSFAAALGVASVVFNNLLGFPGADPSVVLYGFIFLVALGIDYNIFLMTRVREESLRIGTRKGVLLGLVVTGGVITSAGIVLAATFAALAVIPILFLAQLAFIVAFGVLLDTIVVRSLLVPALVKDMGHIVWWPFHKKIK